jgi:biopolymer transport protein ExbD
MAVNIKKPPTLNAMQTADMAFIMLCFFMMVTTMGGEFGLIRQLPPWVDTKPDDKGDKIKERNVLVVSINQNNALMVNKEYTNMSDLKTRTKEFFNINNTAEHFPEKEAKDLPLLGTITTNKTALVSLQNDRATSYRVYIQAQNELAAAINELRDEFCLQRFGNKYENCTPEQQDVVGNQIYKMAISEAEPKDHTKSK